MEGKDEVAKCCGLAYSKSINCYDLRTRRHGDEEAFYPSDTIGD
jgi:hypothetical protein